MGANVIKFPMKQKSGECGGVRLFPKIFTVLLEKYRAKQDELRQRKINFLLNEAYIYIYSQMELPSVGAFDLSRAVYEEQRKSRASEKAAQVVMGIVASGKLDKCYSQTIKKLHG